MDQTSSTLNIICLESPAFYALMEEVINRLKDDPNEPDLWIDDVEAMQMLRIKSKTTLQKLRDEGAIRFSQPKKKWIVYYRPSILEYLEKHAKETF